MRLDCAGAAGSGGQFGAGVDLPMKLRRGVVEDCHVHENGFEDGSYLAAYCLSQYFGIGFVLGIDLNLFIFRTLGLSAMELVLSGVPSLVEI